MLIRKPDRLSSILKASKYGQFSSAVDLSSETKDYPSPLPLAKNIHFDLNNNNVTSIGDLDMCNTYANNTEENEGSYASTMASSKISFEGRSLSRGLSLMTDLGVCDEEEAVNSPDTYQSKVDDEYSSKQEIEDLSPESQANQEGPSPGFESSYQYICPSFDLQGAYASSYIVSDNQKTVTHAVDGRFSAIFGDKPLPASGKSKFSVSVECCSKENPRLYVGVVSQEQKDKPLGYKAGWYFVNTFSSESYLNGLKTLKQDAFAKQGQILSVLVDMDEKLISFELDGAEILKGKLIVSKNKKNKFYPCVSLGELGGAVSFV